MNPDEHPVDADTEVLVGGSGGHPAGESVYHLDGDCGTAPRPDDRRWTPLRTLNGRWRCCRYCDPDDDYRAKQATGELDRVECPLCGRSMGHLPQHLRACDGGRR
jgi:hypothetical protein